MSRPPSASLIIQRGDVWWAELDPTRGSEVRKTRPVVVLTADGLNRARDTIVVVPLSAGPVPRLPIVVPTPSAGTSSVAICDQMRAIDKGRLLRREARLDDRDLRAVEQGVRTILVL